VEEADKAHTHIGGTDALAFLFEDELFYGTCASATTYRWPVDTGIAMVKEQLLPVTVIGTTARPVSMCRLLG
jgi:hypothetical protein